MSHDASFGERLAAAREDYAAGGLSENDLLADPVAMFERWYAEVRDAGVHEPNAMVAATAAAGSDGQVTPSARTVLLKGVSDDGFRFFTNTGSRKGIELGAHQRCALLFPWHSVERQVRVDGTAAPLPRADVEAYFSVRPRGSQLGAWASHQSQVVADRGVLESAYVAAQQRFSGGEVPVPQEWGGYVVRPETVEFWQGRTGRLHDRLVYRRDGGGWRTERLAP